jgi:hypothetical protein
VVDAAFTVRRITPLEFIGTACRIGQTGADQCDGSHKKPSKATAASAARATTVWKIPLINLIRH